MILAELVLRNPNLELGDYLLDLVLGALATVAAGVNWCAFRRGVVEARAVFGAVAVLAAFYAAGYAWLCFSDVEVGRWSNIIGDAAVVTWPVVWTWPAVNSLRQARRLRTVARRVVDEDLGE